MPHTHNRFFKINARFFLTVVKCKSFLGKTANEVWNMRILLFSYFYKGTWRKKSQNKKVRVIYEILYIPPVLTLIVTMA